MTKTIDGNPWCEMCARDAMIQGGVFVATRTPRDSAYACVECGKEIFEGQLVFTPAKEDDDTESN